MSKTALLRWWVLYTYDDREIKLTRQQMERICQLRDEGKASIVIGDYDHILSAGNIKHIEKIENYRDSLELFHSPVLKDEEKYLVTGEQNGKMQLSSSNKLP